jgi:hypothetical protein
MKLYKNRSNISPSSSKHVKVLERIKIWSWLPKGPETKANCAGEGQQQFTRPTEEKPEEKPAEVGCQQE